MSVLIRKGLSAGDVRKGDRIFFNARLRPADINVLVSERLLEVSIPCTVEAWNPQECFVVMDGERSTTSVKWTQLFEVKEYVNGHRE